MGQILLTGGLGYIGSHVAVELADKGFETVIIDDLSNSEFFVLNRLKELTGTDITFEQGDVRDIGFLERIFDEYSIDGVIHFAAKKAVGESVRKPLLYFDVNVNGLVNLLKVLEKRSIDRFIFSSSCTIYGELENLPVSERTPFGITPSPYGKTKQMGEQILESISKVCSYKIVSLRYFNPVGAHESAMIGELPKGVPNNLVPFITQTAAGLRQELSVFGGDYDTPDGSAIRDYIHVVDLAKAHVSALGATVEDFTVLNVGTGHGHSVLEVVKTFEEISGLKLPYQVVDRREGDIPVIYGETTKANEVLDWKAERGLKEMMTDAWRWQESLK